MSTLKEWMIEEEIVDFGNSDLTDVTYSLDNDISEAVMNNPLQVDSTMAEMGLGLVDAQCSTSFNDPIDSSMFYQSQSYHPSTVDIDSTFTGETLDFNSFASSYFQ